MLIKTRKVRNFLLNSFFIGEDDDDVEMILTHFILPILFNSFVMMQGCVRLSEVGLIVKYILKLTKHANKRGKSTTQYILKR